MLHTDTKNKAKGRESGGRTQGLEGWRERLRADTFTERAGTRARFGKQWKFELEPAQEKWIQAYTLFIEIVRRLAYKFCSVHKRGVRGNYCGRRNARNGWTQKDNTRTTRTVRGRAV